MSQNVSDDLMNLIEVTGSSEEGHLLGFMFANKHSKSVPNHNEHGEL